tara:strand:+ start:244740 stop:245591 length:852 start_codon:yes stop_codon:yes gene_type:complete
MPDVDLLNHLGTKHDLVVNTHKPLSGGDINDVYLLHCKSGKYVIKINDKNKFPKMFLKESNGLKSLASAKAIHIPATIAVGDFKNTSYLILEYIDSVAKKPSFWTDFGHQMADLHRKTADNFGLNEANYIGSLKQINNSSQSAEQFYIEQRLEPQFKLAIDNGYDFKNLDAFYKSVAAQIPHEAPSLTHGDLWAGNFMVNNNGLPCLIDPAVAYAPREIDIAVMHLFGGFDSRLFQTYNEDFPLIKGWENRLKLWQLYHILVHVNLFGGHYYASAKAIIKQYS